MVSISFKRGDTFRLTGTVTINNVVQNITGWTIASQIRYSSTFVDSLTVTLTDPTHGIYTLTATDTSAWPTKTCLCDIQYTMGDGTILSTDTFEIVVVADITQP